jgi:L-malate glycosyltransferase
MKISFLMPNYDGGPSGGFRVVYEYANRLTARGHEVSVIQPRRLKYHPPPKIGLYGLVRRYLFFAKSLLSNPKIQWHDIDERVKIIFVSDSDAANVPDGDIIFATNWHTVESVVRCPESKGKKCYLVQGYESYNAPKELVDATWRAPLHKVVISKWLADLGEQMGCDHLTYIPNGIDHDRYRLYEPIAGRERIVAMLFSSASVKGARDGIEALKIVRERHPDTKVILFGTSRRTEYVPAWVEFHRNPHQDFIIKEIYSKAQVFVSASWMEGFALPPAEAAACGCAIASTDSQGVREFLTHGVTGLLSPPKDPKKLAENINLLLEQDDFRIRIANAGQQSVMRLQWEQSTQLLENFMSSITSGEKTTEGMAV